MSTLTQYYLRNVSILVAKNFGGITAWKVSKYGVFFWSVFSRIWTEFLYFSWISVRMQENTDRKKLRSWTLFIQWITLLIKDWKQTFIAKCHDHRLRNCKICRNLFSYYDAIYGLLLNRSGKPCNPSPLSLSLGYFRF